MNNMSEMHIQLLLLDLSSCFLRLPKSYRAILVQYIQDEYAGIDDEFAEAIDVIVSSLYDFHDFDRHTTEAFIDDLTERLVILVTYQEDEVSSDAVKNLEILLENIVENARDVLESYNGGVRLPDETDGSSNDDEYSSSSSSSSGNEMFDDDVM